MEEPDTDVSAEQQAEEPDCEDLALQTRAPEADQEIELEDEDEQAIQVVVDAQDEEFAVAFAPEGLGPPGGGWGGATAPANRVQAIGTRNGLSVTSRKRSSGNQGSDHHTSQRRSDAVDMSNGTRPTPEMDRVSARIAALLGVSGWRGGNLVRTMNGYRVQLLYRTNVGGNHFNHVHVGVRML